jgi:hypothetical protein
MLTIVISEIGANNRLDVTDYLDDGATIGLTDERERSAFERIVGDLTLKLSNMNGTFSDFFSSTVPTTRWEVDVRRDGVTRWLGEIDNESIEFDHREKWTAFDCFSKTKTFWDRCKARKIWSPQASYWGSVVDKLYLSLDEFLYMLDDKCDLSDHRTIWWGIDTGPYADRQLRGGMVAPIPIGNEGRYPFLDPSTTVDELFRAMLIHYNAEMYISPVTRYLTMRLREAAPATYTNIDSIISQRHDIKSRWLDSERYDYVKTFRELNTEGPTVLNLVPVTAYFLGSPSPTDQLLPGTHTWRVIGYINNEPRMESAEIEYTLPPGGDATGWKVWLRVPYFPGGFTDRALYRKDVETGRYFLVKDGLGNSAAFPTDVLDEKGRLQLLTSPSQPFVSSTFEVYERFSDATGWDDPIVDYGSVKLEGKIFDARAELRWLSDSGAATATPTYEEDEYSTFCFFARDMDAATFREQYKDLFVIRRGATFTLKGEMAVGVGDGIESFILPNDWTPERYYIVKKIESDLIEKVTTVEAYSV